MTSTKEVKILLDTLLEPLGMKSRTFVVDYRDEKNNCFNVELNSIAVGTDDYIANSIIAEIERQGYTVYSVYEILNGYNLYELEEIIYRNPMAACDHIRPLYLDLNKEWA